MSENKIDFEYFIGDQSKLTYMSRLPGRVEFGFDFERLKIRIHSFVFYNEGMMNKKRCVFVKALPNGDGYWVIDPKWFDQFKEDLLDKAQRDLLEDHQ